MVIDQVNDDVVITRGEYTFTFGGCTLRECSGWIVSDFVGCYSNEDLSVFLDLSRFEYESLIDQIRKQLL